MYFGRIFNKKNKPNDLLVSGLKIVLALHPSDQHWSWSEGGAYRGRDANSNKSAYQNLKSYGGGGAKPSRGGKPRKYGIYFRKCSTICLQRVQNVAEILVCKGLMVWKSLTHIHILDYIGVPPPPSFWEYFKSWYLKSKLVFQHKLTKQTWRQVRPSKINARHIPSPLFQLRNRPFYSGITQGVILENVGIT